MRSLSIDIETYSSVDLTRSGVYAYTASPDFEILLLAYGKDEEPVQVVDLAWGEKIPLEIEEAIRDHRVIKRAFNGAFERICLSAYLKEDLNIQSWRCTSMKAAALGYPLSLDGVAKALGLQLQKMTQGKDLIRFFTMPCKNIGAEGGSKRNLPWHHWERWIIFKEYCKRDVEVERAINKRLKNFELSPKEQMLYQVDQRINHRGVLVDLSLVDRAIQCDYIFRDKVLSKSKGLISALNPNSPVQVKQWLRERGIEVHSLSKQVVENLVKEIEGVPGENQDMAERLPLKPQVLREISEVLKLRLMVSRTSIKKYEAIKRAVSPDNRVRGLFQFYGANRTGRWAGRLVQVQNLPQNHHRDLKVARDLLKEGRFQELEELFHNVPDILSQLIRTAFIPRKGHEFIVADFSSIEARVLAWLAGEQWRMKVFQTHGKIYEASASIMFNVPEEEITKESELRQKGKIAELALGYGGSVGALTAMGALDMGLREAELMTLVKTWRAANPSITKFWWDINLAVIKVLREGRGIQVGRIKIYYENSLLFIELPSGRRLSYVNPRLHTGPMGKTVISYEGITPGKKWGRVESYGPKFVENIVQAISRDILGEAMVRLEEAGHHIVLHVHDEIVIEAPLQKEKKLLEGEENSILKEVCDLMEEEPPWAKGLTLKVEGFPCEFYRK